MFDISISNTQNNPIPQTTWICLESRFSHIHHNALCAVPMIHLREWKNTEETLSNPSVFLINKNIERSIYLCVQRKKKDRKIKNINNNKKSQPKLELSNNTDTRSHIEGSLVSMLVTLRSSLKGKSFLSVLRLSVYARYWRWQLLLLGEPCFLSLTQFL